MAKVLLVEDDNNLREIYQARLQAEGYEIASARDGEEALVVAKQEQPDLVISDVMMPKISGFEMLDILRNTEGLKDVKVIMLTALGQAEDQTRADNLGADRYLVKSQVTLEDIVTAARDLLNEAGALAAAPAASIPEPALPEPQLAAPVNAVEPIIDTPVIPLAAAPPETPEESLPSLSMPPTPAASVPNDITDDATLLPVAEPVDEPVIEPAVAVSEPVAVSESAPVSVEPPTALPQTNSQEVAAVEQQIEEFVSQQSGQPEPQAEPATPEPVAVEPEVTTPETTPEQEKALNDALHDLGATPEVTEANAPAAVVESSTPAKKVIAPISDDVLAPEKSLDDLLAAEAVHDAAESAPAVPAPPKPPTNPNDFDPNSIAL